MANLTTTLEDVGNIVEKGLRLELKSLIKAKLLATIDETLENMAIDIANNIVINAESMRVPYGDSFGPETRVVINFGLTGAPMTYDTKTKEVKRKTISDAIK